MKVDYSLESGEQVDSTLYKDYPSGNLFRVLDVGQQTEPKAIYMKVKLRRQLKKVHPTGCVQIWPEEGKGDVFPPFPDDREIVPVPLGHLTILDYNSE